MRSLAQFAFIIALSPAAGPATSPPPTPGIVKTAAAEVFDGDRRLQRLITVSAPGRSIDSLLRRFAFATSTSLTADEAAGDQKVILEVHADAVLTLRLLATHFNLRWERLGKAGSGEGSAYRLISGERSALAGRLRQAARQEATTRVGRRLDLAIRALDADAEELERIRRLDPEITSLVAISPIIRARIRLAALMNGEERRLVASGGRYVSPPLNSLSPDIAKLAIETAGVQRLGLDAANLRMVFERENQDGADAILFRVIGEDSRPVGSGGGVTYGSAPRREAAAPVVSYATDPSRDPRDPKLSRAAILRDSRGRTLSIRDGLPKLLEAFSRVSGLNILSDYYSCQSPRFEVELLGERPLWQLLSIISEQFCLKWTRQGSFLLLRHREWFEVEPEEIPERLLTNWRTSESPISRVDPREFLATVCSLTPAQMAGLQFQVAGARLSPPLRWEMLLVALPEDRRNELLGGRTIMGASLPLEARRRLAELLGLTPLPSPEADAASIRLSQRSAELVGAVEVGSTLREFPMPLPLKTSPLPEVVVTNAGRS